MDLLAFEEAFRDLTGNAAFPWQRSLYDRFSTCDFPEVCNLPTGLGKTNVIAVWLVALLNHPNKIPRRLVYVVNRRTVVDQTTTEVEKIRANFRKLTCISENQRSLAISTLRGQFADNREWSADPSRPAVICGTVDMIGSRLLFSGYNVGFKARPLHAGFLGQDALLVHDEAHLEPAFQRLIETIVCEQVYRERTNHLPWPKLRVMQLTATTRNAISKTENVGSPKDERPFELTDAEKNTPEQIPEPTADEQPIHLVWRRLKAQKLLCLTSAEDDHQVASTITATAAIYKDENAAVLVFVRTLDAVNTVRKGLDITKRKVVTLTGTMRGKERDELVDTPEFKCFFKGAKPGGTVYLICTSAGEVGIDISADHMVCDLTTFDSMAQRLGRVHRYGEPVGHVARIDVVYPASFGKRNKKTGELKADEIDKRRSKTLDLLRKLPETVARNEASGPIYDASPKALGDLRQRSDLPCKIEDAFAPPPTILSATDVLFDAWALTTIRDKLPGRPPVEAYLHGITSDLPETQVVWREEVAVVIGGLLEANAPKDLLEDYPLKPHELLRDRSDRVFDCLKKLDVPVEMPLWIRDDDGKIEVKALGWLREQDRAVLNNCTILLPPSAGGLANGMLSSDSPSADDVADKWLDEVGKSRRIRLWDDDPVPDDYRLIRIIDTRPNGDEDAENVEVRRFWRWFELRAEGDSDGSKSNRKPVLYSVHVNDVVNRAKELVAALPLPDPLRQAIILAAKFHDLGKKRPLFQKILGNRDETRLLAKSGKNTGHVPETYRHEFGSIVDVLAGHETDPIDLAEFNNFDPQVQDLIHHLIAAHHGYARPHFPEEFVFDPVPKGQDVSQTAVAAVQRFARLQRTYGRWGLAYLESLLRAADWHASANPSKEEES